LIQFYIFLHFICAHPLQFKHSKITSWSTSSSAISLSGLSSLPFETSPSFLFFVSGSVVDTSPSALGFSISSYNNFTISSLFPLSVALRNASILTVNLIASLDGLLLK
jgi:hypothetical protein